MFSLTFPDMTKTRTALMFLTAMVAALITATAGAGVVEADMLHRPDLRAALQRDADELIKYGAPGVLVGLQTPAGNLQVRSGLGNVQRRTPVPWNAKFRIGSYTKTFVATTLLQMVGEGKLSLDDTVDALLPGMVRGNGNDGRKITVRQLLQHTSGLPEYLQGIPWIFEQEGFEKNRFTTVTAEEAVELAMGFEPDFAPGTGWSYSNTNYALAGLIIERISGHTWQQEVHDRILRPLGLRDTYAPFTNPTIPRPHAVGYERFPGAGATPDDPKYGEPIDATLQNPSWGGAAGAMISTPNDGNRFLRALLQGKVLKPAQLAEMRKTVRTNEAFRNNWPGARYGLGLVWMDNACGGSWFHGGDIMGFMTRNGATPDGKRSVMVSFNTDSLKRDAGVPKPTADITNPLIEHALCGVR